MNLKNLVVLLSALFCTGPMANFSAALAALPGDDEMSEAKYSENAGNDEESEKKYLEAIEKLKDSKRDIPLSFALDSLGDLYLRQNQLGKAADAYKKVVEIRQAAIARGTDESGATLPDPTRKSLERDLGLAMMALGMVYTRQKDYANAESLLLQAWFTIKNSWGPQHDCTGAVLAALGDVKFAQRNYVQAGNYYRQAIAIRKRYHALSDLSVLIGNNVAVSKALAKTSRKK